jgi:tyrosine-specific transport protein
MLKVIFSLSIISGTIIGAGLFALPYLTLKVGFWVILGYFLVLGPISVLIHSFFGELALKTKDFIRLPGFAQQYLGQWGYRLALVSGILGLFGASLVYLIIGGRFLTVIAGPVLGGGEVFYTFIYFLVGAILVYFGIKAINKVQFWGLILFFLVLLGITVKGWSFFNLENLSINEIDKSYLFMPYGVILFSLWGLSLVPEAEEFLGEKRHLLTKIIPWAVVIPIIVYLFFIVLVLGITGKETTSSALDGLDNFFGNGITGLILFFGILTTFTSFIALNLTLKKILWYDLKINEKVSWMVTCFLPFSLFLFGFNDFIKIMALLGGIMLAVDGVLVSLMYNKIKPSRKFIVYPVILTLIIGLVYEIIYSLK